MNQNIIATLLFLNIAATAGIGGWMASKSSGKPAVDLTLLKEPLENLSKDVHALNTTVQRMNTSLVQYDFLEKEQDNLGNLERGLTVRGQAALAAKTPENAAKTDEAVKQIEELLKKVTDERTARRQTMLQLIAGLERQLAGLTGAPTVSDKVPAEPPATSAEGSVKEGK
jgi:predicted transcriptional regulator